MSKATLTVEGFVANELQIREAGGHRVLDVSIPHTPSKKDETGQWVDSGPTTWYQATFWDEHADVVLRTIQKGSLVTASGFPEIETYIRNDGSAGGKVLIKFPAIAAVIRRPKLTSQGDAAPSPAADDVWSQPGTYNDETPF